MNTPNESKRQERALTTTSHAVLALLALREHSTYDLAKQARISFHYFWPRAESNVYAEPKRLVEAGLATARDEWNGGRRRTVYGITDAGREELARWLDAPSAPDRYESEALLKVFFAEHGSKDGLLDAIRALGAEASAALEHWQAIADRYAGGDGPYPHRFALSGLVARLLGEQEQATARWAAWAEEIVAEWPEAEGADASWGVQAIRATGSGFGNS
jgi:PadR family transcriptional regulator AphA